LLARSAQDHALLRSPGANLDTAERRAAFARLAEAHHTVKLHLTTRCNLRCRNCYSDASRPEALSRAELLGLLAELRGRPCRLDLLGGEPTLHPDLEEVVTYARREAGVASVFLYTNGTRIDDAMAQRLVAAGLDTAIVSLHAPEAAEHEQLTGAAGSFEATVHGLDALIAAGVRTYTFTVACAVNAAKLTAMPAFAKARGAGALFFPYVPQRADDELRIVDPETLRRTLRFIIRSSYVYRSALLRSVGEGGKLCRAFVQTVTVLADGSVTPCPFVALPLGNIRETPLYQLLVDAHRHRALAEFLADPGECASCRIRGVCGGGCKAGRFTVHGELGRRDLCCLHGPFVEPVSMSALPDCLPYVY
jgi:radical SAM protein with 4Fe4S-binding SPASM domain